MTADWSISRLQSWTCSSLPTVAEFVKLTQSIVIEIQRQSADLCSVGASPDSDSDSMGESESESGLGLYPCGLGLGLGLHLCGLGLKCCGLGLWSYGLGLGLGLHPAGLGLTVSPGESGEKSTRQIQTFMYNNGRNKGKELIKLLN